MVINEHFFKADTNYELATDGTNSVHVKIKGGEAIILNSLSEFVNYVILGKSQTPRIYVQEDELENIYNSIGFNFYEIGKHYEISKN
jgi:hypothetical protein